MYYNKLTDLGIKLTRRSGNVKTKCPQCSDGRKNKTDNPLSVNITEGEWMCHNCGWKGNVRAFERKRENKKYEKPPQDVLKNIELKEKVVDYFSKRAISKNTLDKFMIFTKEEWMPQTQKKENCICFPYFREGEMVNTKYRDARKGFKLVKDAELIFYNLSAIGERKKVIITEGEIDCMSVYEVGYGVEQVIDEETGELKNGNFSELVAISVPNGASKGNQRLDYLDNCADYFIGLSEIIIATDNDEAGKMLKDELIRRLGVERCKTISYPIEEVVPLENGRKRRCKDFNEVLMYLGKEVVQNVINNAESIPVDGVYYLEDIFDSMLDNFRKGIVLAPTTRFTEMDEYFRWKKGDITLCTGYGNHGKALALDTDIPTIDGWKKMGDLIVGDKVFDENGNICNVTYVTNTMYNHKCYKVLFSDGTEVIADENHLWETYTLNARISEKNKNKNSKKIRPKGTNQEYKRILPKVRTTKEISESLLSIRSNGRQFHNHSINFSKAIDLPNKNLPIDPYTLGVWLGDGTTCDGGLTSNDIEIVDNLRNLGWDVRKRKAQFSYGIMGFKRILKENGFLNNKNIPLLYLRSSKEQRLELLKGLMDTDGYIDKTGSCEFTNINKKLANEVYELITSLGLKATINEYDAKLYGVYISKKYRIVFKPFFPVFKLSRKLKRHTNKIKCKYRYIISCDEVESVPVRCITVDSPSHLYLCTKSFIPTHNTFFTIQLMLTKSIWDGWKWAVFSPENFPANDFYDDIIEMYVGKWLNEMSEEEYTKACLFVDAHFFYVYPDNEHDINSIHEKFRHLVLKKGIDGVMVDPFNQLDSNQKAYQREDQYLSEILKDIKRFALLNNVVYVIIAHPKNPSHQPNQPLPIVDMYDIAGGAMWGNKADQIISYYRPNFHINKNSPEVTIFIQKLKRKRTGGKLGQFDLTLLWSKKRYSDISTHETPCDPILAEKSRLRKANDYSQPQLVKSDKWLPYKNDNEDEIGF